MSRSQSQKSSTSEPDPPNSVGDWLREERQRLGLSQVQLAKRIGVTERTAVAYENGRTTINFQALLKMAAIGIDVSYLVHGAAGAVQAPYDDAVWQRVKAWADEACVDAHGKPLHELERIQLMQRAYRLLTGAHADALPDAALSELLGRPARR